MAKFPANARVDEFLTDECRLSYANSLFKARVVNNQGEPKYGCTLIYPKSYLPTLRDIVIEVAKRAWPHNGVDRLKNGLIKSPILMGTGKEARNKETGELNAGMGPDVIFIRPIANLDRPPQIRASGLGMYTPATPNDVYSGCYGRAVINAFPWNHPQSGDGVSFGIAMFQKTKDGDSLGGAKPVDVAKWYVPDSDDDSGNASHTSSSDDDNPFA